MNWAAPCASHFLWDKHEHQILLRFPPILCKIIKGSDLLALLGGSFNGDEFQYLISVIESVDWNTVPIASKGRPKGWCCSTSHFLGYLRWLEILSKVILELAKYLLQKFVCSERWSFHRNYCLFDLSQRCQQDHLITCESFSIRNTQIYLLVFQADVLLEDFVEVPQVIHLTAAKVFFTASPSLKACFFGSGYCGGGDSQRVWRRRAHCKSCRVVQCHVSYRLCVEDYLDLRSVMYYTQICGACAAWHTSCRNVRRNLD